MVFEFPTWENRRKGGRAHGGGFGTERRCTPRRPRCTGGREAAAGPTRDCELCLRAGSSRRPSTALESQVREAAGRDGAEALEHSEWGE